MIPCKSACKSAAKERCEICMWQTGGSGLAEVQLRAQVLPCEASYPPGSSVSQEGEICTHFGCA